MDSHAIARTSSTRCFSDEPGRHGGTVSPRTPQLAMSEFEGLVDIRFLSACFATYDAAAADDAIHEIAGKQQSQQTEGDAARNRYKSRKEPC